MKKKTLLALDISADLLEQLNEARNDACQSEPEPGRAWPPLADLCGTCLTVKRANSAAIQIRLTRTEDMLPTAAEVIPDEVLESRRRPTQQLQHCLEAEQVSVLAVREVPAWASNPVSL